MVRVTQHDPHRKSPAFGNGLEWIAHQEAAVKGFYCFWGTRMGTEKERRLERQGIHVHEHGRFRAPTLNETLARNRYLSASGITSNGRNCKNYCYAYFHGPTLKMREIIDAAYHSLTVETDLAQFLTERGVVRKELEMYRSESVWAQLQDKVLKRLYGDTAYGATYGDLVKNVPKLTMTRIASIRRLFRPQNLVLVTIGRLDDERIYPHLERTFGQLPKQPLIHAPQYSLPERASFREEFPHPCITIPFIHQVMRCGPPDPEMMARVQLLTDILVTDDVSPLYEFLRVLKDDSYVPFATAEMGRPENLLHLEYIASEQDIDRMMGEIGRELDKLVSRTMPVSDFRTLQRTSVRETAERLDDCLALGEWYIQNSAVRTFLRPREYLDLMRSISRKELAEAVTEWREGMGAVIFKPGPGAAEQEVLR